MFAQVFINIACVYYGHGVQICGSVKTGILISMLMWCTHLFVDFEIIYSHVSLVQKGFNTEKVLKYCQYVDV